jgi:hypothetical protein
VKPYLSVEIANRLIECLAIGKDLACCYSYNFLRDIGNGNNILPPCCRNILPRDTHVGKGNPL